MGLQAWPGHCLYQVLERREEIVTEISIYD